MTTIEERVLDGYDAYLSAFHSQIPSQVLPHVRVPLTVVTGGEVSVLSSAEDIEMMFTGILKGLAEVDYSHTVMESREVTVLDDTMALLRVLGTRLDRSGRALERIAAVYTLLPADDTWQIAVMMAFVPVE
jgi:hypothetical protein